MLAGLGLPGPTLSTDDNGLVGHDVLVVIVHTLVHMLKRCLMSNSVNMRQGQVWSVQIQVQVIQERNLLVGIDRDQHRATGRETRRTNA